MIIGSDVIASGNLASSRRIAAGLLAQLSFLDCPDDRSRRLLAGAGLPPRVRSEPDFPISMAQELDVCASLVASLSNDVSLIRVLFGARSQMGIENLGVIGMAMKHAATALDALQVCLDYPELTMGHCRMVVRRDGDLSLFSFFMDRPRLRGHDERTIDRLVQYCTVLDLNTSLRNIEDVAGSGQPPTWVSLPYAKPADWEAVKDTLEFPVHFDADEACIAYPQAFDGTALPAANPMLFRMYRSLATKMSRMLSDEVGLEERVIRWLWAYSPPLRRGEVADLLAMSERSLTRQLGALGTSYASLLAQVQAERAMNYLRNESLTVAEVSYRLGYAEPAAFTRAFTQWSGVSPLKWRKAQVREPRIAGLI